MDEEKYLKMQFEKGCDIAKAFIDTRYKVLSFVGLYNAAVLSFAFRSNENFFPQFTFIELSLCALSIGCSSSGTKDSCLT